jgi:hypothetical protein
MPLDAEVNRQNDGDNGCGAQHQNRKENFDYHRESGYQNEGSRTQFLEQGWVDGLQTGPAPTRQ